MSSNLQKCLAAVVASSVAALAFVAVSPARAATPDQKPATTLVNGAGSAGEPVAEKLRGILRSQSDLKYVSEGRLLSAGGAHGVDVETLRKGSMRETHVDAIRQTMRDSGAHVVFVLDVFAGKAQLVSIGPEGREQSDVRRGMSGGILRDREAAALLKSSFDRVLPVWKSWIRDRSKSESASASEPRAESSAPATGESSSRSSSSTGSEGESREPDEGGESATDRSAVASGGRRIETGVEAHAGAIAGRHRLNVTTPSGSDYNIQQANPFLGGTFELKAILGRFADKQAGFGLEIFGTYAPFETVLRESRAPGGGNTQYSSSVSQLGMDLTYLNQLSGRFRLRTGIGFEALSLRVEQNAEYTGNRYAQFRFTGGVTYRASRLFQLGVGGGLAPLLTSDMSGGAFGDSAFAPGILGEAELEMNFFEAVGVGLGYRLYFYDLVFRSPKIVRTQVDVIDLYHLGSLRVSYRF